jgi:DNA-binding transcriptional regulator of glucitol operon
VDRVLRTALRAKWLPRHVLALLAVAGLALLGRWQWDVSESERGSLQNSFYAFQWWAMALMVSYGWWRLLRDDAHGRPAPRTAPAAVMTSDDEAWAATERFEPEQQAGDQQTDDPGDAESDRELADYNRYLSWLNTRSERAR